VQGCFWGPELAFARVPGVMSTAGGYANGTTPDPTYEAVCSGTTGHAEVVRIGFDPEVVSFDELLAVFWAKHNPTQVNRQGNDVGTQYRSCILAADDAQLAAARASAEKEAARRGLKALATEIEMLKCYYRAEEYHQARLLRIGGFAWSSVLTRSPVFCVPLPAAIPGQRRAQRERAKPRQAVQRPHPLLWLSFECNSYDRPASLRRHLLSASTQAHQSN
jgi:peptide-methionine (S)-S-oxide reductase